MKLKSLVLTVLGLLAIGCGGSGGGTDTSTKFKFVNASPDSTSLDFNVDDAVLGSKIAYPGIAPAFSTVDLGDHDVTAYEDGITTQLDSVVNTFAASTYTYFLAVGLENPGTELAKRLQIVSLPVDQTAPNGSQAKLIIVHAFNRAAGSQTPSVVFQNPGITPTYAANLDYAGNAMLTVDAGSYNWVVKPKNAEQTLVSANSVAVAAGKIYLVLIEGLEGATGTQAPQINFVPLN